MPRLPNRPALPLLTPSRTPVRDPGPANPWVLWQPVRGPDPYTCTRCGTTQTGERYLELGGTEPRLWPVLPRNPAQIQAMTSRVGRQVLCPACRWATPPPPERPKRRKTTLD